MKNNQNIFVVNVQNLSQESDDVLNLLFSAIRKEKDLRTQNVFNSGNYPPLLPEEIDILQQYGSAQTAMAYRRRTGCDIYLASLVVQGHKIK